MAVLLRGRPTYYVTMQYTIDSGRHCVSKDAEADRPDVDAPSAIDFEQTLSCISRLRFLQKRLIPRKRSNDRIIRCDCHRWRGEWHRPVGICKRALKVFEKGDFARGATGNSSGMIHGGARYLLNDTARPSTHVSTVLSRTLPSTFFEFRSWFLSCARTAWSARSTSTTSTLNATTATQQQRILDAGSRSTRCRAQPGLEGDFIGGVTTDEFGIDTARLCLLNALDAAHGRHPHLRHGSRFLTRYQRGYQWCRGDACPRA